MSTAYDRLKSECEAAAQVEATATPGMLQRATEALDRIAEIQESRDKKKKPRKSLADLAREAAPPPPVAAPIPTPAPVGGDEEPTDPPVDPGALVDDFAQLLGGAAPSPAGLASDTEEDFLASLISTSADCHHCDW